MGSFILKLNRVSCNWYISDWFSWAPWSLGRRHFSTDTGWQMAAYTVSLSDIRTEKKNQFGDNPSVHLNRVIFSLSRVEDSWTLKLWKPLWHKITSNFPLPPSLDPLYHNSRSSSPVNVIKSKVDLKPNGPARLLCSSPYPLVRGCGQVEDFLTIFVPLSDWLVVSCVLSIQSLVIYRKWQSKRYFSPRGCFPVTWLLVH